MLDRGVEKPEELDLYARGQGLPMGPYELMDFFAIEINEAVKLIEEHVALPDEIETAVKLGINRPCGPISVGNSMTNAEVKKKLEGSRRSSHSHFHFNSGRIRSYSHVILAVLLNPLQRQKSFHSSLFCPYCWGLRRTARMTNRGPKTMSGNFNR